MIQAGKLRWPITIYAPSEELSELGEATGEWESQGEDRANIQAASGSNAEAGMPQRESVNWYEVTTRYNPEIQAGRRLLIEGEPYDGKTFYISDSQHKLGETVAKCFERLAG